MLKKENLYSQNLKAWKNNNELVKLSTLYLRLGLIVFLSVLLCVGVGLFLDIYFNFNGICTFLGAIIGVTVSVVIALSVASKFYEN